MQRGKRTRLAIEVAPARYPRWREAQCGCLSRADTGCDKVTAPAFDLRGLGAGADFKTGLYPFETIEPGPAIARTGAKSMPAEAIGFYLMRPASRGSVRLISGMQMMSERPISSATI